MARISLTFSCREDPKLPSLMSFLRRPWASSSTRLILGTVAGLGQVLLRDINAPGQIWQDRALYQVPLSMIDNVRERAPVISSWERPRPRTPTAPENIILISSRIPLSPRLTSTRAETPRAVGVDFHRRRFFVSCRPSRGLRKAGYRDWDRHAAKEVIVSAGAFNTPQLLKLSGIGPKEELQSFNILVLVDLPGVGTNLQDRYGDGCSSGKTNTDFTITSKCTFLKTSPDPVSTNMSTVLTPSPGVRMAPTVLLSPSSLNHRSRKTS